jgi:hypothetical protein
MRTSFASKLGWTSPSFASRARQANHRTKRFSRSKGPESSTGGEPRAAPSSSVAASDAKQGTPCAAPPPAGDAASSNGECRVSAHEIDEIDDIDSVLSKPEGDNIWDDIQFDETDDRTAFDYLEAKFARRDRILDHISQGKSRAFVELMRKHEEEVRSDERERLILKLLYATKERKSSVTNALDGEEKCDSDRLAFPDKASLALGRAQSTAERKKEGEPSRTATFSAMAREFLVYELSTTVPAALSFVAQTLTEYASYEITSILVWQARRHIRSDSDKYQDGLMMLIFVLGLVLMRFSGSLYWWLSDRDYGCVKFEMHNRLRLGRWDARVLQWARSRSYMRCFLFIFGYYLSFAGILHYVYRFYLLWDESDRLMRHLPSSAYDRDVCMADLDRFSCEAELQRRERHFDSLEEKDREHVYWFWSDRSYDLYWVEGVEGVTYYGYPLLSKNRELLLLIATLALSLSGLTWYGFIFWNKY